MPLTSPRDFGKDHWKLLVFIESCIVDHGGKIDVQRMRCHPERHPRMAHKKKWKFTDNTQLSDNRMRQLHDDWDCLEDLRASGWVDASGDLWMSRHAIKLSRSGWLLAHMIRRHVGEGGTCADFDFTTSIVRALLETRNGA